MLREVPAKAARVFLSQPAYFAARHWRKKDIEDHAICRIVGEEEHRATLAAHATTL
jgi:hypothetical protein